MRWQRRTVLKWLAVGWGTTALAGTWWLKTSNSGLARLGRMLTADLGRTISPAPVKPTPAQWDDNRISLAWLGHATMLINFYGLRILIDPVLSDRVGYSFGLGNIGPKRFVAPALALDELPPIDVLLLSHAHMDHLDLPTLETLAPAALTVTAKDTTDLLGATPLRQVSELSWGERTRFRGKRGDLEIEAFEVRHWGRRWPSEKDRGYNGYLLRREDRALLFGGDTAFTKSFAVLRAKGPFAAGIMPIGAYNPWIRHHCNPEEALEMANLAGAQYLVPIHHRTFHLSDEPLEEPLQRFETALAGEPARLAIRRVGETFVCPKT